MRAGIRAWAEDVRETMADDWKHGLMLGGYYAYVGANLTLTSRRAVGTHPYERDWDALVILDACRVDALQEVQDEFSFIKSVNSITSVGSTSGEWMAHTFDREYQEEIARTAMVTANVHSETVLRDRVVPPQYVAAPFVWPDWDPVEPDLVGLLDEVWRYEWDDELGTVPPRAITDQAITTGRTNDHDRLIIHYLQPHAPYLTTNPDGSVSTTYTEPLDSLRRGEISRAEAWDAYLETLRLVLSDVELLLDNLDAEKVILTADHGEAFGETGFYEHPVCCPHPVVKKVPWVELTAADSETYEPATSDSVAQEQPDVTDQLEALGYV